MTDPLAEYQEKFEEMVRQATVNMQKQIDQANNNMRSMIEKSLQQIGKSMNELVPTETKAEPKAELRKDGSMIMNKEAVILLMETVDGLHAAITELEKQSQQQ